MRSAMRVVASAFGAFAGLASIEHGVFEVLQGDVRPDGIMIASMGPPCQPDQVWNACEPAMTIVPSFLATGILAIVVGIMTLVWAVAFVQRKHGGLVLVLLSIVMLLVGGGIFPPLIGIIGGAVGTRIDTPLAWWRGHLSSGSLRALARLWPWALVALAVWLLGQAVVGYLFGEFMLDYALLSPLLVIGLLVLTVLTAFAHDVQPGGPDRTEIENR